MPKLKLMPCWPSSAGTNGRPKNSEQESIPRGALLSGFMPEEREKRVRRLVMTKAEAEAFGLDSDYMERSLKKERAQKRKALAMKQDPLARAVKKAYRESLQYKLDRLMAEQVRWSRKQTLARNKLEKVRAKIDLLLWELVEEKEGRKP